MIKTSNKTALFKALGFSLDNGSVETWVKTYSNHSGYKLKVDVEVEEGDPIPNFEDWVVLETPGHTDRDLTLWHAQTKQAYTADLILCIKDKFVSPYLITLPNDYRASLNKIKALQPTVVLLAHDKRVKINDKDFDLLIDRAPKQPRKTSFRNILSTTIPKLRFARKRVKTP